MNLSNKSHLKERSQIETMVNIKLLYKVKNVFKMNSFILYCAFILKILGMLLISHSYDKNSDINVNTYIRKITACYNSNISCINKIHYPSLCIIIYILLIAPPLFGQLADFIARFVVAHFTVFIRRFMDFFLHFAIYFNNVR